MENPEKKLQSMLSFLVFIMLPNTSLCAQHSEIIQTETLQWSQTNQNVDIWSRERFIAKRKGARAQIYWIPWWFWGKVFIGKIWGEGCSMCDFRLIGWWWDKDAPGILYSASTWVLSSCKRTQRYCYVYSLRRNQNLAPRLHYCFFFFFLELKYDFIATFLKILFIYLFIYF